MLANPSTTLVPFSKTLSFVFWVAKLLAEGGKTSRRRRQNFVLQALQSEALYGVCTKFLEAQD